jgi:ribosome-associated protein
MQEITISTEYIKLDQFLKFSELVDSGGVAKLFIKEELVRVNGDVCTSRGKKLHDGDIVDLYIPDEDGNIAEIMSCKVVSEI